MAQPQLPLPAPNVATPITEDRILRLERVAGKDLIPHPLNWRVHPKHQLVLLQHSIARYGVTTALLGYESERNNGKLTILDGHGRVEIDPERVWPVLVTNLNDEEADSLLLLIDPISALAETDASKLLTLTSQADIEDPVLSTFFAELAQKAIVKDPNESLSWPSISVSVPPDIYQVWLSILSDHDGNARDAFLTLLNAYGPFPEGEELEGEALTQEVKKIFG
jgi:hypothetical protein